MVGSREVLAKRRVTVGIASTQEPVLALFDENGEKRAVFMERGFRAVDGTGEVCLQIAKEKPTGGYLLVGNGVPTPRTAKGPNNRCRPIWWPILESISSGRNKGRSVSATGLTCTRFAKRRQPNGL